MAIKMSSLYYLQQHPRDHNDKTRQRLLGNDHLDITDDTEYLSRLEGEKKTESVLVRGRPLPILSTPGPTPGLFEDCQKKMIFVIFKSFAFTARLDSL